MFCDNINIENKNDESFEVINFNPGVMDTQMQEKIRGVNSEQFPDVERYRQLKETNKLQSPKSVALRIIEETQI